MSSELCLSALAQHPYGWLVDIFLDICALLMYTNFMKNNNGLKLINTNPYLSNRRNCAGLLIRDAIVSCRIEGVDCKNLEKKLKSYSAFRRKAR